MPPRVIAVSASDPADEPLQWAADVLRRGGLVVFPTETVYGLGANALDPDAVARIFAAKGRPATNPVIVHVADVVAARELVTDWPDAAGRLAERFWPGPLTLVLPKRGTVPGIVTAAGPTVGVRVPAHPVALAMIRAAGLPIAAPSANRSLRLSPTAAEHVVAELGDSVDLILNAGRTSGGIESTVIDVSVNPPRLLRPGLISADALEAVVGPLASTAPRPTVDEPARSPGQMSRHYAPRARLELVAANDASRRVRELATAGARVGWLTTRDRDTAEFASLPPTVRVVPMPGDPSGYATELYAALHDLDRSSVTAIVVEDVPDTVPWRAIRDRLTRAATRGV